MHADAARGVLPAAGDGGEMVRPGLDEVAARDAVPRDASRNAVPVEVRLPKQLPEGGSVVREALDVLE